MSPSKHIPFHKDVPRGLPLTKSREMINRVVALEEMKGGGGGMFDVWRGIAWECDCLVPDALLSSQSNLKHESATFLSPSNFHISPVSPFPPHPIIQGRAHL